MNIFLHYQLDPIHVGPSLFGTQFMCGTQFIWDPVYLGPNSCGTQFIWDPIYVWDPVYLGPNLCVGSSLLCEIFLFLLSLKNSNWLQIFSQYFYAQ